MIDKPSVSDETAARQVIDQAERESRADYERRIDHHPEVVAGIIPDPSLDQLITRWRVEADRGWDYATLSPDEIAMLRDHADELEAALRLARENKP